MSAGGPGSSASTTRAPSDSSRPTHASATSLDSVSRPSARFGRLAEEADGAPREAPARDGTGCEHRPQRRDLADRTRQRARPCRTSGQSGKTPSIGTTPWRVLSPTISQAAAGSRIEQPGVRADAEIARGRRRSPRRCPLEEPPVVCPGLAGLCTVPYHSFVPEHAPRELGEVRLADHGHPASSTRSTTVALLAGHVVGVDARAVRGADPLGVDQVLDEQRCDPASGPSPRRRSGSSSHVMPALPVAAGLTTAPARRRRPRSSRRGSRAPRPRRASRRGASRRRPLAAPG